MATAFRIHEDIDNALDLNKENNVIGLKNNGNDKEKRPTLAILNNITFDGRAHASKTVSVQLNTYFLLFILFSLNNTRLLSERQIMFFSYIIHLLSIL